MKFATPLVPARLVRRYKRFLSDMTLETCGADVVAHCPNPGAMLGLKNAGLRCWLEPNDDPKKKLKYGWRLVEFANGHLVCVDTGLPNRIVGEALAAGQIAPLADYTDIRAEVPYSANSRIDFLVRGAGALEGRDAYVEVKNVTLRRNGDWAEFPDCVTARGAKHLSDLIAMVEAGHRAVMIYLVTRTDCGRFCVAADLDPAYAQAFDAARAAGVEMLCYRTEISPRGLSLGAALPIDAAEQAR